MSKQVPAPGSSSPALLNVREVAHHLSVSTRTLRRLISNSRLQIIRVGRSVRVSHDALSGFMTGAVR